MRLGSPQAAFSAIAIAAAAIYCLLLGGVVIAGKPLARLIYSRET